MAKINWSNALTEQERRVEKISLLSKQRKAVEEEGVVVNGARFSGDAPNRQALNEALQLAETQGLTSFSTWKDSNNEFFPDFSVSDVRDALTKIGVKRGALITKEAQYAAQVADGTLTDITGLDWTVSA